MTEIEKSATNSVGPVRQQAGNVLPLLRQLVDSYNRLLQAVGYAHDVHFKEAQALKPNLPLPDECIFDNNLFVFRRNLENSWANFEAELPTVMNLTETFANRLGSPDTESVDLLYWRDEAKLTKVFRCDSLDGPFPNHPGPSRRENMIVPCVSNGSTLP